MAPAKISNFYVKAHDSDSVDINCFAKYLDFAKFLEVFIMKSRNLDISQK